MKIPKPVIFVAVFLLAYKCAHAQNLIKNCGFEDLDKNCGQTYGGSIQNTDFGFISIGCLYAWKEYSDAGWYMIPEIARKSGRYAGGIMAYPHRQILQTKLCQPLEKGKLYHFRMYVRPVKFDRFISSSVGVLFSDTIVPVKEQRKEGMSTIKPHIENAADSFLAEERWYEVKGDYLAKGGEQYLAIANFRNNTQIALRKINKRRSADDAIIFIVDDLHLYADGDPTDCCRENPEVLELLKEKQAQVLGGLRFPFDSAIPDSGSLQSAAELAAFLKSTPDQRALLIGHTDSAGNESRNMELSIMRAKAIYDYLIQRGIPAERLRFEGEGAGRPVASNATEEGRIQNRRVEVVLFE